MAEEQQHSFEKGHGKADSEIPVSVVMRSYNDAPLLPRTLEALDAQEGVAVELLVFESASTDDSVAIFESHGFEKMVQLEPGSYWSSKVLNEGVRHARHEVVVFLNSDAILTSPQVLHGMASRLLASEKTAGVFARQLPRPDAGFMTRLEFKYAFDQRESMKEEAEWLSLVCSAVRRSVWRKEAFDERITYAEDAVWTAAVKALGFEIAYVPGVAAEHSHEYTWTQRYDRSFNDAVALGLIAKSDPSSSWLGGFLLPWIKRSLRYGLRSCLAGKPWMAPFVFSYQYPLIDGQRKGAALGWRHFSNPDTRDQLQPLSRNGQLKTTAS
ncbi:MAG: glycosyltransferase [Verrucomicrobiota bacterium]